MLREIKVAGVVRVISGKTSVVVDVISSDKEKTRRDVSAPRPESTSLRSENILPQAMARGKLNSRPLVACETHALSASAVLALRASR